MCKDIVHTKGHGGGSLREEADAALRAASQQKTSIWVVLFISLVYGLRLFKKYLVLAFFLVLSTSVYQTQSCLGLL